MTKVGVVLSGCGVYDGSEIHEAVCTLLALSQAGAEYQCLAPDVPQYHVVNHLTGEPQDETRSVLVESARIARGEITALDKVDVHNYDAFFFPGGFGAAKNLCSYAIDGAQCDVNPQVARIVREAHAAGIPLGFVCIAPVLPAAILGQSHPNVTVGQAALDPDVVSAIQGWGGVHHDCPVDQAVIDRENRIVTSPAYMTGKSIADVYAGISQAIKVLLEIVRQTIHQSGSSQSC